MKAEQSGLTMWIHVRKQARGRMIPTRETPVLIPQAVYAAARTLRKRQPNVYSGNLGNEIRLAWSWAVSFLLLSSHFAFSLFSKGRELLIIQKYVWEKSPEIQTRSSKYN